MNFDYLFIFSFTQNFAVCTNPDSFELLLARVPTHGTCSEPGVLLPDPVSAFVICLSFFPLMDRKDQREGRKLQMTKSGSMSFQPENPTGRELLINQIKTKRLRRFCCKDCFLLLLQFKNGSSRKR